MISKSLIKKTLKCLSTKRLEDVNEWKIVGAIIKNELKDDGYELFKEWSKSQYEDKSVDKIWKKLNNTTHTFETLKLFAKEDNIFEYTKAFHPFNFKKACTTTLLAEYFKELFKDRFVHSKNKLYFFNGVYWEEEEKNIYAQLNKFISNQFYKLIYKWNLYYQQLNLDEEDDDKRIVENKNLQQWVKDLNGLLDHKKREKYIKDIICHLNNNGVEFDNNKYLFAFKNKIYDLKLGEFTYPNYEDYVSMTTGYNYDDDYDTEAKVKVVNDIIDTIFPNKEILNYYMTILSTGLDGQNLEKFVIANGGGRNGKGLLNELMQASVGKYCYILPSNLFTGTLKKGSNPEVANLHNVRIAFTREPEEGIPISASVVKELTGGDEINARLNHSNDTEISLCLTLIMECNKKPRMSEVNNATAMRIEDIPFESTFYKKEDYDNLDEDEKATAFIGNKEFKSKHFKKAHRQALFEILRTYYKKYLDNGSNLQYSESIKKRNKDYLLASDRLNEFVNENYKLTKNDKDRIKLKTVYEDFKISDYYRNLTKQEMNNLTYKKFQENLQENYFLKKFIKLNKSNVLELRGFVEKEESDDEEEEEDNDDYGLDDTPPCRGGD